MTTLCRCQAAQFVNFFSLLWPIMPHLFTSFYLKGNEWIISDSFSWQMTTLELWIGILLFLRNMWIIVDSSNTHRRTGRSVSYANLIDQRFWKLWGNCNSSTIAQLEVNLNNNLLWNFWFSGIGGLIVWICNECFRQQGIFFFYSNNAIQKQQDYFKNF